MTVEEVATLAKGFGWSYETLMSMSGAERRLWLAAGARVSAAAAPRAATPGDPPPASAPAAPRMTTDAERRARLLELHEELNRRGR